MAQRHLADKMNHEGYGFRAIELNGALKLDHIGIISFNQILLLDDEQETLCFVEANIRLIVTLAFIAKKAEYKAKLTDITAMKTESLNSIPELVSAYTEKFGCRNLIPSGTLKSQIN